MPETIYIGTDHTARLNALADDSGTAVVGADVTATLLDKQYQPIAADPFPLTFADIGAGNYSAHIGHDHGLALGRKYNVRYTAIKGGLQREFYSTLAVERSGI